MKSGIFLCFPPGCKIDRKMPIHCNIVYCQLISTTYSHSVVGTMPYFFRKTFPMPACLSGTALLHLIKLCLGFLQSKKLTVLKQERYRKKYPAPKHFDYFYTILLCLKFWGSDNFGVSKSMKRYLIII